MVTFSPVRSANAEPILPAVGITHIIFGRRAIFYVRSSLPGILVPRQNCQLAPPGSHLEALEDVIHLEA